MNGSEQLKEKMIGHGIATIQTNHNSPHDTTVIVCFTNGNQYIFKDNPSRVEMTVSSKLFDILTVEQAIDKAIEYEEKIISPSD